MASRTGWWLIGVLLVAAALRLVLWYVSPVFNANDDHLFPIGYYATNHWRPAPDACWQCYQPPLYYAVSAAALQLAHRVSGDFMMSWRAVQLLNVLLSVAQLAVVWRILFLAGARALAPRVCALVVLAVLPRDFYNAVFLGNDVLLGFAVTLAILVYLETVRLGWEGMNGRRLALVLASVAAAAWTKQHGLIVALLPLALVLWERRQCLERAGPAEWQSRRAFRLAVLGVGLLGVGAEELYKLATTGHLLVSNQHYFDWPRVQPPGEVGAISFFDFRLAALVAEPTLSDATTDSFWTEIFAKLWFDYDPKFLAGTAAARAAAAASYVAGFLVSLVWGPGVLLALQRWRGAGERLVLMAVQLAYLAVPLIQTLRFPYYSSMKAVFALPAVSISAVFLSLGFEWLWERRALRIAALALLILLGAAATAQVALSTQEIEKALFTSWKGGKLWPLPAGWRP